MKILHLEASTGWGGQEIRILREAEGMRKKGHELILVVATGGVLAEKAWSAGFKVYEVEFKKSSWPFTLFSLLKIMRGVDIVNTHSSLDSWIGGIAARIAGKKILRTRHLSTPIKGGLNARVLYGALADFVVTTCEAIIPSIQKVAKCRSIATGVDPTKIVPQKEEIEAFRKGLGVKKGDFLVGTACVMRSWKGVDDLLKAADLLRDVQGLKWVIVGGGHAERHLLKAQELKLEGIVHFTGHLDSPFAAIGAMDVFMLLSTANEGVSQAILQAAFLKRALIATRVGGLSEVCIDEKTGILINPFSPKEVAAGVMRLKGDRSLCARFGEAARALVEEKFTLAHTLDQMEEVYDTI
jgi:glycosyltransferase involved in cell wall biosynthesis